MQETGKGARKGIGGRVKAKPDGAKVAADRHMIVQRAQRGTGGVGAQLRAVRKDGWTVQRRKIFIETLAATCNVTEAARVAERTLSSAYNLKRRDPAFAREWSQALSVGYAELEALLLRQSLFGSEQEEVTLDAEGMVKSRKVKRGHPHAVGVRLLAAHARNAALVRRAEETDRPDGEDAVARLRATLEEVRRRSGGDEAAAE